MPSKLDSEPFNARLKQLNQGAPKAEIEAAVIAYERLLTARAICRSVIGENYQEPSLMEIFTALDDLASTYTIAGDE